MATEGLFRPVIGISSDPRGWGLINNKEQGARREKIGAGDIGWPKVPFPMLFTVVNSTFWLLFAQASSA